MFVGLMTEKAAIASSQQFLKLNPRGNSG